MCIRDRYGVLQEKKLTCEVDVEEDLMIYGDPDKLARVFDNILRNAIAYCYANTEIRIEAKIKDGDIEITFTNAGDKIPGDMLQTIFEKDVYKRQGMGLETIRLVI